MSQYLLVYLVTLLTGSPLLGLLLLLSVWILGDRVTFRLLPDPFRWVTRWRRRARLRTLLSVNPHDRRARFELAELLVEAGQPAQAAEVLRPNLEAGDDDVHTAFVWGTAQGRAGHAEQAERAFAVARAADPRFRDGELDLELGRQRVERRDFAGAREALERLLELRPGSVEGRFFLARALDGLGLPAEAGRRRDEAWREYQALPRFQRSRQRPYAWRVRPWRPALVALAVLAAAAVLVRLAASP